jgi:hypothetical protein
MNYKLETPYSNYTVSLEWSKYSSNGRIALQLIDAEDGSPIMTATVNIPDVPLQSDEMIIKNYSENEGVLEFLQENKIVGPIIMTVQTGFFRCPVVKKLV